MVTTMIIITLNHSFLIGSAFSAPRTDRCILTCPQRSDFVRRWCLTQVSTIPFRLTPQTDPLTRQRPACVARNHAQWHEVRDVVQLVACTTRFFWDSRLGNVDRKLLSRGTIYPMMSDRGNPCQTRDSIGSVILIEIWNSEIGIQNIN